MDGPTSTETRIERQERVALENVAAETRGTRPECAYVGGHADGYDPDCAWCHGHEPAQPKVTHKCELVERHTITILIDDLPTGVNARVDVAKLHAEAWSRAHGLDLIGIHVISGSGMQPGSAYNGVTFDVHVGHADISTDQRVPGALDTWTWSARVQWWAKLLRRIGRPVTLATEAGRVVSGPWNPVDGERLVADARKTYNRAVADQILSGQLHDEVDQRPPWLRRADGWDEDAPHGESDHIPPGLVP